MATYRDINYAIRPGKNIERKMILETIRRIAFITELDTYRYIGFGSTYFTDFELFHKELNLKNMISIESGSPQERFKFNLPYSFVNLKFGMSSHVLPKLFSKKTKSKDLIWLDYDKNFIKLYDKCIKTDIDHILSNIEPKSIFLLSFNIDKPKLTLTDEDKKDPKKSNEKKLKLLEELELTLNVSLDKDFHLEPRNMDKSLFKDNIFQNFCKNLIDQQIEKCLLNRNQRFKDKNFIYEQLFYFIYKDGAPMMTVGGIFYEENDLQEIKSCNFNKLFYIRPREVFLTKFNEKKTVNNYLIKEKILQHKINYSDNEPYIIKSPNLTLREVKYLNKNMPKDFISIEKEELEVSKIIPADDIKKYKLIYRYYPSFTEANL